MSKNNGGPAFPIPLNTGSSYQGNGMTLRDYMAIHASDHDVIVAMTRHSDAWIAKYGQGPVYVRPTRQKARYMHADAMLAERAK